MEKKSSKTIKWINLQQEAIEFKPSRSLGNQYRIVPDLFFIGEKESYYMFYTPLLLRIYMIPKDFVISTQPIELRKEYFPQLIESMLMLPNDQALALIPRVNLNGTSNHIRLILSSRCNSNCSYCYAGAKSIGKSINLDHLETLINYLPENLHIDIELHGNGEPTIAMQELKKAYKLCKKRFKFVKFSTQTNGLFSKKTADWLIKNQISTSFSIDGPEFIHNKQRPAKNSKTNGFNKTMETLRYFQEHNLGTSVICVVTAYSNKYLNEIYQFFKSINIKTIKLNPVVDVGNARLFDDDIHNPPDISEFAQNFALIQSQAYLDKIMIDSDFMGSFHTRKPHPMHCQACMPQFVLDTDGKILACSEAASIETPDKNPFYWAEIKDNQVIVNEEKKNELMNSHMFNMDGCSNCFLKWICAGSCLHQNYSENHSLRQPIKSHCEAKRAYTMTYFSKLAEYLLNGLPPIASDSSLNSV
ncbi:MAG: hypothetical protein A2Y40_03435 [Candidatus Margulisbacteria bacterium GWF2_35_9]|nr:MAG: hypothetical protein A2Y40_03435 [Candidatus Margulisbacteria bacterium GWF2_35_9]